MKIRFKIKEEPETQRMTADKMNDSLRKKMREGTE